jgi:cytochrome P450
MVASLRKPKHLPPGPKPLNPFENTNAFQRDAMEFLTRLARDYGDVVYFKMLNQPVCLVNSPDYARRVLQTNYPNYDKDTPLWRIFSLCLGNGMGTTLDEDTWRRQRRMIQPVFHKQSIISFMNLMQEESQTMLEGWEEQRAKGQPIKLNSELSSLGVQILSKAIFHDGLVGHVESFNEAFHVANQFMSEYMKFPFPPLSFPLPRHRRFQAAIAKIDEIAYGIIRQRRQSEQQEEDLLSMLLSTVDEETGEGMTDQQIRDEVVTFLVSGSESSGITLTCALTLLAQHPEMQERLQQEVDEVLGGVPPTADMLYKLPYIRQCLDETLRLYPAGWMTMRHAIQDDVMGDYRVKAGSLMFVSPYLLHRHPAIWEQPESFDPGRFAPGWQERVPRGAYIPFLAGPHLCIGQHYAFQEMLLVLALVGQRYHLRLAPGCELRPRAFIALYLDQEMCVYLEPR